MSALGSLTAPLAATTGIDAFSTIALIPVVVWAFIAGTTATWIAHRYREAADSDGYEFAELAAATCERCDHTVSLAETIPGRLGICGGCGRALPATWIGGVLASIAGCLAMLATFGARAIVVPYLWLIPVLVTAALVDLRTMLIPKRVVWIGVGVGLGLMTATAAWMGIISSLTSALIGAGAYFAVMFVLHVVNPNGLGFGDVRLAVLLGLYLGWIDIRLTLIGLFIGNVSYLAYALPQRIRHGKDAGRFSPFGPGLAVGTIVAVCCYSLVV
ncbi:MAG TPA: A24 family peptidase [Microthrixaceae bacterium]|nr:A24 family peptidase [Microthrixaceae bacterium]